MRNVVVTDIPRATAEQLEALARFGVATVHEAQGRTGSLGTTLRPIQHGARVAGSAVTALCWPGDNLMIHAAVEQCRAGDILVVTTTSPCTDGLFGELLATSLRAQGGIAIVTATGVRDLAELREMGFPAWSAAVSAQGTVKSTPGAVNIPITVGGERIRPGDAIVADDDGVVCVPRGRLAEVLEAASARIAKEEATRRALAAGELGLDRYGMRSQLERLGVEYITAEQYARERGEPE